jgi:predicted transglutaminase-like protease
MQVWLNLIIQFITLLKEVYKLNENSKEFQKINCYYCFRKDEYTSKNDC